MLQVGRYVFKRADAPDEFQQIHRLNYRTFVEEIPQHAASRRGRLIDKFHAKSTYFVALLDSRVVGMLSVHDRPPFSVAARLPDPSILDSPGRRPMEVRLLAVEPRHRGGPVLAGLLFSALEHARDRYDDVYISGVAERVELYERLGFRPLGPAVTSGAAAFVPMRVSFPLDEKVEKLARQWSSRLARLTNGAASRAADRAADKSALGDGHLSNRTNGAGRRSGARHIRAERAHRVSLLPGPVAVSPAVRAAFESRPVNHRHPEFIARFENVRQVLGKLVGGRQVALLHGSGTLANETIAAALAAEIEPTPNVSPRHSSTRGVILINGEFGHRLADEAERFGLSPRVLSWAWGKPWNLAEVEAALDREPPGSWVWGVHLESSTGVLNDLPGLVRAAQSRGVRVCADCMSSLGAVPLDLGDVYLASGTSGKSLGAYAGIAMVFADARALPRIELSRLPSYLDLAAMLSTVGPRFTFPWSTIAALDAALGDYKSEQPAATRYKRYARLGAFVRGQLRALGIAPLADEAIAGPVLTTFSPPGGESALALVERSRAAGFEIAGESQYLSQRRVVQIATMGTTSRADVSAFCQYLRGSAAS
ncbi:MAG: GNAT family N-acetyltransferase [Pirellulales bacterium]